MSVVKTTVLPFSLFSDRPTKDSGDSPISQGVNDPREVLESPTTPQGIWYYVLSTL